MKEIGIVVCNYNKQDYVIACVDSILKSPEDLFDVYVVDNASTDDSVKLLGELFGGRIRLVVNQDNLGGSGGFNSGIREALKHSYKYIMLVDNDIIMDQDTIKGLYDFMEQHQEVGIAGSKIYFIDYPDRIQTYGAGINFEKYMYEDYHRNCIDHEALPKVQYCDYVPACSLLARTEAIHKVGIIPESNFIYWDDMEWGYRFNLAGYKVAAISGSKVWHKGGGRTAGNTFINYYMWRNRINFFLQFLKEDKQEHFADYILSELFRLIYSCNLKGEYNIIKSVMFAYDDALNGVRGKASDYKILNRNEIRDRLSDAIGTSKKVIILFNDNYEGLGNIVRNIRRIAYTIEITICTENCDTPQQQVQDMFADCLVVNHFEPGQYGLCMKMCGHILEISNEDEKGVYIDPWCNIIYSYEDYVYCSSYKQNLDLFLRCRRDILLNKLEVKSLLYPDYR